MSARLHTLDGRVAIVGAGLAGLMTALRLAPRPVVVVSKSPLGAEGSTLWAQTTRDELIAKFGPPPAHVKGSTGLVGLFVNPWKM